MYAYRMLKDVRTWRPQIGLENGHELGVAKRKFSVHVQFTLNGLFWSFFFQKLGE